ncbi:MAG: VCBS repeat-containing protein, partial [Bacteroidota bacterium]
SIQPSLPALTNLDGDSDDDLVFGVFLDPDIRYFENEGSNTFTERTGNDNPFEIVEGVSSPAPNLIDIDGDGDLDLFLGDRASGYGIVNFFTNEGTPTSPKLNNILVSVPDPNIEPVPVFVNLDGDDDLDLFVGTAEDAFYYENDGSSNFTQLGSGDGANPLQGVVPSSAGIRLSPQLVDIDNDDDLDVFSGNRSGTIDFYINNGGTYSRITGGGNPLDLVDLGDGKRSKPAFVDIDGDEDFDVFVGEKDGVIFYYKNEGDKDTPNFVMQADGNNPLGSSVVNLGDSTYVSPTFTDYDNDGDFDLFVGYQFGEVGQPQGRWAAPDWGYCNIRGYYPRERYRY